MIDWRDYVFIAAFVAIVCVAFGVGGAMICLFMTHESAWQPILAGVIAFPVFALPSMAIKALDDWLTYR